MAFHLCCVHLSDHLPSVTLEYQGGVPRGNITRKQFLNVEKRVTYCRPFQVIHSYHRKDATSAVYRPFRRLLMRFKEVNPDTRPCTRQDLYFGSKISSSTNISLTIICFKLPLITLRLSTPY